MDKNFYQYLNLASMALLVVMALYLIVMVAILRRQLSLEEMLLIGVGAVLALYCKLAAMDVVLGNMMGL